MLALDIDTSHLMWVNDKPELVFTSGDGSWLQDSSGKRYLDFVQGWAVNSLGHCPLEIQNALSTQSARLISPARKPESITQIAMSHGFVNMSHFSRFFRGKMGVSPSAYRSARLLVPAVVGEKLR